VVVVVAAIPEAITVALVAVAQVVIDLQLQAACLVEEILPKVQ
jgi:hypothetical protein